MKELGTIVTYYKTEGTAWLRAKETWYVQYRESFVSEIETKKYHEIEFEEHKPWLLNRKLYKYTFLWYDETEFRVYPEETLEIKRVWMPLKASFSYDYLSSHMECEDFIEYMKDHGMNVCPMRM